MHKHVLCMPEWIQKGTALYIGFWVQIKATVLYGFNLCVSPFFLFQLLSKGNVFTTDAITATLMTATRSVYSWDVIVQVFYLT